MSVISSNTCSRPIKEGFSFFSLHWRDIIKGAKGDTPGKERCNATYLLSHFPVSVYDFTKFLLYVLYICIWCLGSLEPWIVLWHASHLKTTVAPREQLVMFWAPIYSSLGIHNKRTPDTALQHSPNFSTKNTSLKKLRCRKKQEQMWPHSICESWERLCHNKKASKHWLKSF